MDDLTILKEVRNVFHRQEIISAHNSAVNGKIEAAINNKISKQITNRDNAYNVYLGKLYKKETSIPVFLTIFFSLAILGCVGLFATLSYYLSNNKFLGHMLFLTLVSWISIIVIYICVAFIIEDEFEYCKFGIPIFVILGILSLATIITLFVLIIRGWSGFYLSLPRLIQMFPLLDEKVSLLGGIILVIIAFVGFVLSPIISLFLMGKTTWWILMFILIFVGLLIALLAVILKESYEETAERSLGVKVAKRRYQEQYAIYQAEYDKARAAIAPQYKKEYWEDDTFPILSEYWRKYRLGIDMDIKAVNTFIWCIENRYAYDIVSAKQWLHIQNEINKFQEQIEENARKAQERFEQYNADQERRHQERLAAEKEANNQLKKQLEKLNSTAEKNLEANRNAANALNSIDDRFIRYTQ